MRLPEVNIISLDGLNNNGKTTQLRHLKNELAERGIPAVTRRGDGSRKGIGANEADPPSDWWQHNYPAIIDAGFDGKDADYAAAVASRQLMVELHDLKTRDFPEILAVNGGNRGVILLDRGPISRLFVARRQHPNITLEDALGITDDPRIEAAIPDSIIVLHAERDILLARNEDREEGGAAKRIFNHHILTSYYDDFEQTLNTLPPQLAERTTIIDSTPPIEEVGSLAVALMVERLGLNDQ